MFLKARSGFCVENGSQRAGVKAETSQVPLPSSGQEMKRSGQIQDGFCCSINRASCCGRAKRRMWNDWFVG